MEGDDRGSARREIEEVRVAVGREAVIGRARELLREEGKMCIEPVV
jgi:hypothetical protein